MGTINAVKSEIMDRIGDDGETVENMTNEQADELLNWLDENPINFNDDQDVNKLKAWMEEHGL
jgi:hypothetical protein